MLRPPEVLSVDSETMAEMGWLGISISVRVEYKIELFQHQDTGALFRAVLEVVQTSRRDV